MSELKLNDKEEPMSPSGTEGNVSQNCSIQETLKVLIDIIREIKEPQTVSWTEEMRDKADDV